MVKTLVAAVRIFGNHINIYTLIYSFVFFFGHHIDIYKLIRIFGNQKDIYTLIYSLFATKVFDHATTPPKAME